MSSVTTSPFPTTRQTAATVLCLSVIPVCSALGSLGLRLNLFPMLTSVALALSSPSFIIIFATSIFLFLLLIGVSTYLFSLQPAKIQQYHASTATLNFPILENHYLANIHEHHTFMREVRKITYSIQNTSEEAAWITWLENTHGQTLYYPNRIKVQIDLSKDLAILEGIPQEKPQLNTYSFSDLSEDQIDQFLTLDALCFESPYSKESLPRYGRYIFAETLEEQLLGALIVQKSGLILSIATHPTAMGEGIGTALLKKLGAHMEKNTIDTLTLYVRKSNPAKIFYKKFGFKTENTLPKYYQNPTEDALLMSCNVENFINQLRPKL